MGRRHCPHLCACSQAAYNLLLDQQGPFPQRVKQHVTMLDGSEAVWHKGHLQVLEALEMHRAKHLAHLTCMRRAQGRGPPGAVPGAVRAHAAPRVGGRAPRARLLHTRRRAAPHQAPALLAAARGAVAEVRAAGRGGASAFLLGPRARPKHFLMVKSCSTTEIKGLRRAQETLPARCGLGCQSAPLLREPCSAAADVAQT